MPNPFPFVKGETPGALPFRDMAHLVRAVGFVACSTVPSIVRGGHGFFFSAKMTSIHIRIISNPFHIPLSE